MKVLHVITGLEKGGAEGVLARLVQFDQANTHCIISLTDDGYWGGIFKANNIQVMTLNMPRGRISINGLSKLYKSIKKIAPDVIQTWMYHSDLIGGLIGRLAGVRNIVWGIRHSNLDSAIDSRSTILVANTCALLSNFIPKKIVSCSKVGAAYHGTIGYDKSKLVIIPNGYDFSNIQFSLADRHSFRSSWGVSENTFVFGLVARWSPQKNHKGLLEAAALLDLQGINFKCVLAGDNIIKENIELNSLIESLGISEKVILLGRQDNIPGLMSALDLHVLPSLAGEGFPNVVAEAMACETLCLVTDIGDAALIVHEFGWVCSNFDTKSIEDSLSKIMKEYDSKLWSKRRVLASEHVRNHYSIEKMCGNFFNAWKL